MIELVVIIGGICSSSRALKCDHKEADERIFFHSNHAFQIKSYRKIIVAPTNMIYLQHCCIIMSNVYMKIYRNCGCYTAKVFQAEFFQFIRLLTLLVFYQQFTL